MRRDLGLTTVEARDRIGHESRAAAVAAGLKRSLGADFAGARVSGDDAALTVATTDAADAARIGRAGARAVVVTRSLAELDAAKAALDRVALRKVPKGIPAWYVDVATNRVIVQAAHASAADAFLAAADVPSE